MKRSGWMVATVLVFWAVAVAGAQPTALSKVTAKLVLKQGSCDVAEGRRLYFAINNLFRGVNMMSGVDAQSLLVQRAGLFGKEMSICGQELVSKLSQRERQEIRNLCQLQNKYKRMSTLAQMIELDAKDAIDALKARFVVLRNSDEISHIKEELKSWCRDSATRPAQKGYVLSYMLVNLAKAGCDIDARENAVQSGIRRASLEVEKYVQQAMGMQSSVLADLRASRAQRSLKYIRSMMRANLRDSLAD